MISIETEKMIQGKEKSLNPKGAPFTRCLASQKPPSDSHPWRSGRNCVLAAGRSWVRFPGQVLPVGRLRALPEKDMHTGVCSVCNSAFSWDRLHPLPPPPAPLDPECRVSSDRQIVGIFVNVREPGDTQGSGGIDQTPSSLTLCRCVPLTLLWTNQRPSKVVLKVIMFLFFFR